MTGYPSVSKKITCARAAGFLLDDVSVQKGVSYDVPNSVNIHVTIFFGGRLLVICHIFILGYKNLKASGSMFSLVV